MSNTKIAITSGDYYIGFVIARQMIERGEIEAQRLRVLCRDPSKADELKQQGCEVVQVDYNNQQNLKDKFQGIAHLILCVDPENDRVQMAENVMKAANEANVKCVVLISQNGCDSASSRRFQEFKQIEDSLRNKLQNSAWCILRTDFFNQNFLYWSLYLQDKGQFPLPVSKNSKFAPLDVKDLAKAIASISSGNEEQNKKHNRQTYALTGPEAIDGNRLVEELNRGTGNTQVRFQEVKREELERYLKELRNGNRAKSQGQGQRRDNRMALFPPTDAQIEFYVEYFDWVNQGRADKVTQDLKKIIGQDGNRIEQFFKENADEFRPRA